MNEATRRFVLLVIVPTVALVAATVALGVAGLTIPADVVGFSIVPVWAVGLGRALYLSAN